MKGTLHFIPAFAVILTLGSAVAWAQAPRAAAAPSGIPVARPVEAPPSDPASAASVAESRRPSSAAGGGGGVLNSAAGDYIISTADALEMSIYREPELSTRSKVGTDGTVQLPLIRDVKVAGLTVRAARELIRKLYDADYLVDPDVHLNLIDFAQRQFTIIGQVQKPGAFPFPGGRSLSLLEAVGLAGGFTRSAKRGEVLINRTTEGGAEGTIKVNAKKPTGPASGNFPILPGDVITVGESWW